ncbi:22475_t:CDS:2 [Gigaspora margarita]|uniref:22475_t:CDS:1 n=1 Tax=Gigaspora margarita TaxID=4874 RepID=A0ABN7V1J4_GIGMA|nr:22475_t:CDS:2 [Gigaspora margarita]
MLTFFILTPGYSTTQVASATFLVEDDKRIIEDPKVEEAEYDLEIIVHFDIENIVCLNDEIFQDSESNSDSEEFQDYDADEFNELDYNELISNKTGQGVFDFDPAELAANL